MKYKSLIILALYSFRSLAQPDTIITGLGIIDTVIDLKVYPCFDPFVEKADRTEYVIDSDSSYTSFKQFKDKSCHFPFIDFNEHTLLGILGVEIIIAV